MFRDHIKKGKGGRDLNLQEKTKIKRKTVSEKCFQKNLKGTFKLTFKGSSTSTKIPKFFGKNMILKGRGGEGKNMSLGTNIKTSLKYFMT